jgi:hypothetical protein
LADAELPVGAVAGLGVSAAKLMLGILENWPAKQVKGCHLFADRQPTA